MARTFGRDHDHVQIGAWHDLAEVDVEAMGESQRRAFFELRFDLPVNLTLVLVGGEGSSPHRPPPPRLDRFDRQAGGFGLTAEAEPGRRPTITSTPESRRLSAWAWPLGAVADDGDGFTLDQRQVGVFVVIDIHGAIS